MNKALIIVTAVSCSTPTTETASTLCRLDPETGRCATYVELASEDTQAWVYDAYPTALGIAINCAAGSDSNGHHNVQCSVTFEYGGTEYGYGCSWWDTGSLDCSAD